MKINVGSRYYIILNNRLYTCKVLESLGKNMYYVDVEELNRKMEVSWLVFSEYVG